MEIDIVRFYLLVIIPTFTLGLMSGYILARNWSISDFLDRLVKRAEERARKRGLIE